MPNDCFNKITIRGYENAITTLLANGLHLNNHYEWSIDSKGSRGVMLNIMTSWEPPFEHFEYLIEKYKIWLKCEWYEEGGTAGLFLGYWDEDKINLKELVWEDWCVEDYETYFR